VPSQNLQQHVAQARCEAKQLLVVVVLVFALVVVVVVVVLV
jgi:hypothetical protein